jgi:hypothetical protein
MVLSTLRTSTRSDSAAASEPSWAGGASALVAAEGAPAQAASASRAAERVGRIGIMTTT